MLKYVARPGNDLSPATVLIENPQSCKLRDDVHGPLSPSPRIKSIAKIIIGR